MNNPEFLEQVNFSELIGTLKTSFQQLYAITQSRENNGDNIIIASQGFGEILKFLDDNTDSVSTDPEVKKNMVYTIASGILRMVQESNAAWGSGRPGMWESDENSIIALMNHLSAIVDALKILTEKVIQLPTTDQTRIKLEQASMEVGNYAGRIENYYRRVTNLYY